MKSTQLSAEIAASLSEYKEGQKEKLEKIINEVSTEALKELEAASPKKTNAYAKGWRKRNFKDSTSMRTTIYNSKKPSLTNLLENGHINRDKKTKARSFPHIKQVEETAIKEVESRYINEVQNE